MRDRLPSQEDANRPTTGGRWAVLSSLSGYRRSFLPRDIAAGVTLAAIAIPEQMATAHLGGFPPEVGLYAFIAGSVGFAIFGVSRCLSAGADSTITPIFAGGLVLLAAAGTAEYASMAAMIALIVGAVLIGAGLGRLGWIADLLSVPVVTGFLAGISLHIIVSQLPSLLGVAASGEQLLPRVASLVAALDRANPYTAALGFGVLIVVVVSERISPRIPGALIGIAAATVGVVELGLADHGVAVLGNVPGGLPHLLSPAMTLDQVMRIVPLAMIISVVVMVQTAATTRSFVAATGEPPDINRDFVGIGAGNILAGLFGAFPVNASPPRTAIAAQTGGRSQIAGLVAAALVLGLVAFGAKLLAHVPQAALAGVLIFIALRIFRVREMVTVWRRTKAEFLLIIVTMASIVALPIETGVAVGIVLSLMHGMWSATRAQAIEFVRVPGTSIWWAPSPTLTGETLAKVVVVAFQAPLSFLNADDFRRGVLAAIDRRRIRPDLVVLEASDIIAIDYTAATILADVIDHCRDSGITFAIARLESVAAQEAFTRFGIIDGLGRNRVFRSVDEAIGTLAGGQ